jgi:signal transduction histidine kinase
MITMTGVAAGVFADLPEGTPALTQTIALVAVATGLLALALSQRIRDLRIVVPALAGVGLCGAVLYWQADGPGLVLGYISLVGLALRAPRRIALLAGTVVVAAIAAEAINESENPASTGLAVLFAFALLFLTSAFAAVSLDARRHAERLLAQEAAASQAREQAAALAERSRLARELHDVVAHSLSALTVQLEVARLAAIASGAGSAVVGELTAAHRLTRIGMLNARRAVRVLRDDDAPGPETLPDLIAETSAALGIPITLDVSGSPVPLGPEAGLTLYRVVQEALTNVAKHAGRWVRVAIRLNWAPGQVEVSVTDSGGDGTDAGLPSSKAGLTGMAERAALTGGQLEAGPSGDGFTVRLRLPAAGAVPGQPS